MKFYAQAELDELYRQMKKKPYSEKSAWEKFINDEDNRRKKERKRRQHEFSYEHIEKQEGKG